MGRLQLWLQRREWWTACWIGNRISDARYYLWRAHGGKCPEHTGPTLTVDIWASDSNTDSGRDK